MEKATMQKRFEYKVERQIWTSAPDVTFEMASGKLHGYMNEMGEQGWELFKYDVHETMSEAYLNFIWKREKVDADSA